MHTESFTQRPVLAHWLLLLLGLALAPLARAQSAADTAPPVLATPPRPLESMAPPLPLQPAAAAQGVRSLELSVGGQHLTNGYGPWRELALRGAYGLPGDTLQGELSRHHRFGEDGTYVSIGDTHDFNADWFGSAFVGAGDGAFYLPRYRVDLSLARKWLPARNLVTSVGAGYYDAPDGHTDRSLLLGAVYYFEQPWIAEGGIRFNNSNPGSVDTRQYFVALSYGRQKADVVTARVGWGREGYLAVGPSTPLVDFSSREASLAWRHWLNDGTGVVVSVNGYSNPLYRRTGATVGLFHDF